MATAKRITMPGGHKGLTRRTLLGGLPLAGASLALPFPMGSAPTSPPPSTKTASRRIPCWRFPSCAKRPKRNAHGVPPRRFWSVEPTGVYGADCGTGARYAHLALDYMVAAGTPWLLQWSVFDMMRLGREYSGIEVGFMSTFGRIATAAHAARLARGEGVPA